MPSVQFLPVFPERPTNPARTNVATGDIEINAQRWTQLTPEEREFVLQHEIGHYKQHTFNEVQADRYALRQLALKKPYSLINYLNAVSNISYCDPVRVKAAQLDTLHIAAQQGSQEAKQLLRRYAAADGTTTQQPQPSNRYIGIIILCTLFIAILLFAQYKHW